MLRRCCCPISRKWWNLKQVAERLKKLAESHEPGGRTACRSGAPATRLSLLVSRSPSTRGSIVRAQDIGQNHSSGERLIPIDLTQQWLASLRSLLGCDANAVEYRLDGVKLELDDADPGDLHVDRRTGRGCGPTRCAREAPLRFRAILYACPPSRNRCLCRRAVTTISTICRMPSMR